MPWTDVPGPTSTWANITGPSNAYANPSSPSSTYSSESGSSILDEESNYLITENDENIITEYLLTENYSTIGSPSSVWVNV